MLLNFANSPSNTSMQISHPKTETVTGLTKKLGNVKIAVTVFHFNAR